MSGRPPVAALSDDASERPPLGQARGPALTSTGACPYIGFPFASVGGVRGRRSIRLRGYDYTQAGSYFVTIVAQERRRLFGEVADGIMHLSDVGRMVRGVWEAMPSHYPGVDVDAFVVMPDHIHGIVVLATAASGRQLSLADVVHRFKSLTTRRYFDGVAAASWPACPGRLWHWNYYERVVRDDRALQRIRAYIADNPIRWSPRSRETRPAGTPDSALPR